MNEQMCVTVRELIPDFVADRLTGSDLAEVDRHVLGCTDCADELDLARAIFATRPSVPEGLLERLTSTVTTVTRVRQLQPARAWWSVVAAAVAALALGIGISSDPVTVPVDVPGYAYEVEEGDIWLSDDGLLAGAPLFDDLSDDALLQLLDELSIGSAGGSA